MGMNDETLTITFPGGRQVAADIRGHHVLTDQPVAKGGHDTAPSPYELFLASIGTCAGIFVQGFCAARGLSLDGVRLHERPVHGPEGTLRSVELELELPEGFPERYREPLVRVMEQCSVKKAIAAQPTFAVRTTVSQASSAGQESEPAPSLSP